MKWLRAALALLWLGGLPPAQADGGVPAPTGRWQGGGRACHGTLAITPRRLSWHTPFSRCTALPYRTEPAEGGATRYTLLRRNPGCRFQAVVLGPVGPVGPAGQGWQALGLPPGAAAGNGLACPLVRLQ